jgi:hypothetical protein
MDGISLNNDRRYTLKEVAEKMGTAYRTVANYANKAGWTVNGKKTLLTEKQVTLILEALKRANLNQHDLASSLQGTETALTSTLKAINFVKNFSNIKDNRDKVKVALLIQAEALVALESDNEDLKIRLGGGERVANYTCGRERDGGSVWNLQLLQVKAG